MSEWISVKERLPEVGERVLTLDRRGNIRNRRLRTYLNGDNYFAPDGLEPGKHITHWMPLPKPPEKEEAET